MTGEVIYQPEPPFIVEVGTTDTAYSYQDSPVVTLTGWEFHSAYFTEQNARGRADELAEDTFYVRVVLRRGTDG